MFDINHFQTTILVTVSISLLTLCPYPFFHSKETYKKFLVYHLIYCQGGLAELLEFGLELAMQVT